MNKRVLVLMATYNGKKYLEEQIESVFNQKAVEVFLLVRDDGSKDGTKDILAKYKRTGRLDWYTGEHLNVAQGYMDLLEKSKRYATDYIAFSDQDDVWDEDKLIVAIERLEKNKSNKPSLYYSGQCLVDKDLQTIGNHELNKERTLQTRFVLSDFAGCTGVFNIELRDAVTEYKPTYILMHDTWILKVCLSIGGDVIVDPKPHMKYRQHGGNAVGLGRSISAYLKQVKQYLNEYKVEPQMRELIDGYGDRMISPYKEIAVWCCEYRKIPDCKKKLLDKNNIDFCARGLNLTYFLKVKFNKL